MMEEAQSGLNGSGDVYLLPYTLCEVFVRVRLYIGMHNMYWFGGVRWSVK